VGGTGGENGGVRVRPLRLQLDYRVRPILVDHRIVAKSPKGSRQPGRLELLPAA
jgi:hypothetical protein